MTNYPIQSKIPLGNSWVATQPWPLPSMLSTLNLSHAISLSEKVSHFLSPGVCIIYSIIHDQLSTVCIFLGTSLSRLQVLFQILAQLHDELLDPFELRMFSVRSHGEDDGLARGQEGARLPQSVQGDLSVKTAPGADTVNRYVDIQPHLQQI